MHKEDIDKIIRLSEELNTDLEGFIGKLNDELTRARINERIKYYFASIRSLTRMTIDLNKVGLCNISKLAPTIGADFGIRSDHPENEIVANAYTRSVFRNISRFIEDNQVPS